MDKIFQALVLIIVVVLLMTLNHGSSYYFPTYLSALSESLATNITVKGNPRNGHVALLGPKLETPIKANDTSCQIATFIEYYHQLFFNSSIVPFDSSCLEQMIQSHPTNINLRIAHVRRRYFERLSHRAAAPAPTSKTTHTH